MKSSGADATKTFTVSPNSWLECWSFFLQLPFYRFRDFIRFSPVVLSKDTIREVSKHKRGYIVIDYSRADFEGKLMLHPNHEALFKPRYSVCEQANWGELWKSSLKHYLKNVWRYSPCTAYLFALLLLAGALVNFQSWYFHQYSRFITRACDAKCVSRVAESHLGLTFVIGLLVLGWIIPIFYFWSSRRIRISSYFLSTRRESILLLVFTLVATTMVARVAIVTHATANIRNQNRILHESNRSTRN